MYYIRTEVFRWISSMPELLRQPACSIMINVKSLPMFADGNAALEISKARQKAVQTVVSEACLAFLMTLQMQLFVPESFKDSSVQVEFKHTSMLNALLFCLNNKYLAVQDKSLFLLLKTHQPLPVHLVKITCWMRGSAVRPACVMLRKLNAGRGKGLYFSVQSPSFFTCNETTCAELFIEIQSNVLKLRMM